MWVWFVCIYLLGVYSWMINCKFEVVYDVFKVFVLLRNMFIEIKYSLKWF